VPCKLLHSIPLKKKIPFLDLIDLEGHHGIEEVEHKTKTDFIEGRISRVFFSNTVIPLSETRNAHDGLPRKREAQRIAQGHPRRFVSSSPFPPISIAYNKGLDKLTELVHKWRLEPSTYSPTELRACLDSFREVLFRHLDEEVCVCIFFSLSFSHSLCRNRR
jgi:hypothetical protein